MAESRYGRLFTEADVRRFFAEATEGYMEVNDGPDLDVNLAAFEGTFPADEPLFLMRGQDEIGSRESLEGMARFHAAARRWQEANPDRVKAPD